MMLSRRTVLVALACLALCPLSHAAAGPAQGLGFGTREFTGQDKTGTV